MDITVVNRSRMSDESLKGLVDFLAPQYRDVSMPVVLLFKNRRGSRCAGRAWFPILHPRGQRVPGVYYVNISVGENQGYPFTYTYKKRAGPRTITNLVEDILYTISHEVRHVEQFDRCKREARSFPDENFYRTFARWEKTAARFPSNSSEVDAEMEAFEALFAYRIFVQSRRTA